MAPASTANVAKESVSAMGVHLGIPPLFYSERNDRWWIGPMLTALVLILFGLYSTWAAWQNEHYEFGPYLSPFYSPLIQLPWVKFSPAFLILWAPLGFRATCYYYRKAYYRAFFLDPPGCGVGEFRKHCYRGEKSFPFILQNIHRYFMYVAVVFIFFLWHDVYKAFWFTDTRGASVFGVGIGTLVLLINTSLLSGYTFGCHALRHLVGGKIDGFSCSKVGVIRHKMWEKVSCLTFRHQLFAWCSLLSVGFADLYVRLCSMGVIPDVRLF